MVEAADGCCVKLRDVEEEAHKNFHNFIVGKKDNEQKSFFSAIIV